MQGLTLRRFAATDAPAAAQLFFDAIREGSVDFYTEAQRKAWASHVPETARWRDRLARQFTVLAEAASDIVGYMTLDRDGYIDLAFVAPRHLGRGVADALYAAIETRARNTGVTQLTTEASHQARRFFKRNGWDEVREQTIMRNGVALTNFKMSKRLG